MQRIRWLDQVENIELSKIVRERRGGKKVSLDDLWVREEWFR